VEKRSHQIFLEVRQSNLVAQRLYESNGFNRLGVRHGYYPDRGGREDAIIYAKHLTNF
jgi:ribosomal-protein-alanine N-acetyltransferase